MDWALENSWYERGFHAVCGVDEAGRGPLAGPVCAAAVILPPHCDISGIDDSKKLTEKKREQMYGVITERALAWSVAFVDAEIIDKINILQATLRAMHQAVDTLSVSADAVLVDGNQMPPVEAPGQTIVSGDARSPSIAAASILAKVSRDRLIRHFAEEYPQYGFEKHKGYGTKLHYEALLEYGPCPLHRKSFLQKFYAQYPEAPR